MLELISIPLGFGEIDSIIQSLLLHLTREVLRSGPVDATAVCTHLANHAPALRNR